MQVKDFENKIKNLDSHDLEEIKNDFIKILEESNREKTNEILRTIRVLFTEEIPKKQNEIKIEQNEIKNENPIISESNPFLSNEYLKIKKNRFIFISDNRIQRIIYELLSFNYSQYNILKILWQISYSENVHIFFGNFLNKIIFIIKNEKENVSILRICIFILINLLTIKKNKENQFFISIVNCSEILADLDKMNGNTYHRVYQDIEFIDSKIYLKKILENIIKKTSCIQNYLKEIFSGNLEKAPYHYNDSFWCTNVNVLHKKRKEIIRALKRYLSSNLNNQLVAANDIYKMAKNVPESIEIIEKVGIKDDLIMLSECNNSELKFWALKCLTAVICEEIIR